jgi:hypothetical protein
VHHRTLSGADLFPYLAKPTVGAWEPLAHRTLSGAHRTVRCSNVTVGSSTRHARNPRPAVAPADRWLIGQSGAPPDSPVNFSRMPPSKSREQPIRQSQPGAPDTVRCTTSSFKLEMQTRCSLQASTLKSLHLLQIITCSTQESLRHSYHALSEKSWIGFPNLESISN